MYSHSLSYKFKLGKACRNTNWESHQLANTKLNVTRTRGDLAVMGMPTICPSWPQIPHMWCPCPLHEAGLLQSLFAPAMCPVIVALICKKTRDCKQNLGLMCPIALLHGISYSHLRSSMFHWLQWYHLNAATEELVELWSYRCPIKLAVNEICPSAIHNQRNKIMVSTAKQRWKKSTLLILISIITVLIGLFSIELGFLYLHETITK